jgi:hypothetical protein
MATNKKITIEEPATFPKLCECGPETMYETITGRLTTTTSSEYLPLLLPETVSVIGKTYRVCLIENNDYSSLEKGNDGECDHDNQIIKIRLGKADDYIKDTFLHECIHALEESFKLDFTEKQVERLATGLLAILNDNPQVKEFLLNT